MKEDYIKSTLTAIRIPIIFLVLLSFGTVFNAKALAPTITSISPLSGAAGTLITVAGTNLGSPTAFTVGGTTAIVISNTGTLLVGMVMPGTVNGNVTVTTAGGTVNSGSSFTVTANYPSTQQGNKLVGTGGSAGAGQGYSVAVSADGNTAVIGGYTDSFSGAVWIYTRSGGVWTQQGSKLIGTGGSSSRQGSSVAISADGNTIIEGAPDDNSQVGAAWIFTRSAGTWTQQGSKLVGTGYSGTPHQGSSVSISSDGNTVAIGGYHDGSSSSGAIWIYTRSGGVWTQQGNKLTGSGAGSGANMGWSVSLSADGKNVIAGAPNYASGFGSAYVFINSAGVWTQQAGFNGSGNSGFANQGYSVAISANGNTAMIGGPGDNSSIGAVWVFTRSGTTWTQQGSKIVANSYTLPSAQGSSVSLSADGNAAIVGGYADNNYKGASWVYTRSNGVWRQQGGKMVGTGNAGQSRIGESVSISADGTTAVVGGDGDNSLQGAAWIYSISACTNPDVPVLSTSTSLVCNNQSATLTITSGNLYGATTWHWYSGSCGGTSIGTGTSVTVSPTATTTYYARGEGGCVTSASCNSIIVNQSTVVVPSISELDNSGVANYDGIVCSGDIVYFMVGNTTPYNSFSWSNGGGSDDHTNFHPTATTTYTLTVTNSVGCTASASRTITVDPLPNAPVITVNNSTPGCPGTPVTLTASAGNYIDYRWIPGNIMGPSVTFSPGETTLYSVIVRDTNHCANFANHNVVVILPPVIASSYALSFDGSDDYVSVSPNANIPADNSSYTIEAWIYANSMGDGGIAGWGDWGNDNSVNAFRLSSDGLVNYWWGNDLAVTTGDISNAWHHVAATYDNNTAVRTIYLDGNPVGSDISFYHDVYLTDNMTIGVTAYVEFFNGKLDEVRIWNTARTQAQIQAAMNTKLTGNETGLKAYYNFDQGVPGENNGTVTSLHDQTSNHNNGTLTNFNLNGSSSNWIAGKSFDDIPSSQSICVGSTIQLPSYLPTGGCSYSSSSPVVATVSSSGLISGISGGTATISISLISSVTGCSNTITKTVTVNQPAVSITASPSATICGGESVTLNAVNAGAVNAGNAPEFNGDEYNYIDVSGTTAVPSGNSNYTIEAWIKPTVAVASGIVGWGSFGADNEANALRLDGPTTVMNYWWGNDLSVTVPDLTDGNWHHIAATYNGVTRSIYTDGILRGQDTPVGHNVTTTGNMAIGRTGFDEYFNGAIDEVRIWSVSRSQSEIQTAMNKSVLFNSSGLASYYKLDDASGIEVDATGNGATGFAIGYVNWIVPSTAPIVSSSFVWNPGGATTTGITVSPTVTTNYTVQVTDENTGCTNTATQTVTVGCNVALNLKLFIQGYYIGGGQMQRVLFNDNLSSDLTACDSVTIELHSASSPYSTIALTHSLLHTDGSVTAQFPNSIINSSYYIVIRHRNAIETWSKIPVAFNSTAVNFDFTTP